jgi:hypothetical protein
MTRVLFVGQQPETVDFSDPALPPGFNAEKIHAGIAIAMKQMTERGWDADLCLVRPDGTAAPAVASQLASKSYDGVVIGGGIRMPPKSLPDPPCALMIVGDDGVLTAKAQRAVAFHVDGIARYAFPGGVDRLDGSDKPITGRLINPVADSEFCFHIGNPFRPKAGRVVRSQCDRFAIGVTRASQGSIPRAVMLRCFAHCCCSADARESGVLFRCGQQKRSADNAPSHRKTRP